MFRADKGSSRAGLGENTLPSAVRTIWAKVDAKEEWGVGENGVTKGRGEVGDQLFGKGHGNVPERHELSFGPVGKELEGLGAEGEEEDEDGAGLAKIAQDKGAIVKVELEIDETGRKMEAAAPDERSKGDGEEVS